MSQFLTGSVCLDDILAALRSGHSAFSRGNNGKVYIALKQWINDEADQYGNHSSILLNSRKEASAEETAKKIYIGNMKIQSTGGAPLSAEEATALANTVNLQPQSQAANPTTATQNQPVQTQQQQPQPVISGPVTGGNAADGLPF